MADEKKDEKPARKSRRAALYDHKKPTKPEAKAEPETKADAKPEASAEHAEMLKRHETERRDMHGRHRTEHRAIEPGSDMLHKKISAHRRHEAEFTEMHGKHEKEMLEKAPAEQKDAA
jgi:hypothetical protein